MKLTTFVFTILWNVYVHQVMDTMLLIPNKRLMITFYLCSKEFQHNNWFYLHWKNKEKILMYIANNTYNIINNNNECIITI